MRYILIFSNLFFAAVLLSSCLVNSTETELFQPAQTETKLAQVADPIETTKMEETAQPEISVLILEIPVIEYEDGNQLTEPIITGYDQAVIEQGDEFVLDPAALGFIAGKSVGAVKLKLVKIYPDSISVEILADASFDATFQPRDPVDRLEIKDGTCIDAFPLVMDVFYQYCFELEGGEPHMILRYRVEGESTMPKP